MELILYTNNSDNKVVTKNITTLATIQGTLRSDCSIIDPVITVSDSVMNNAMAAACNYAKIAQFGRYYYVNNIVSTGKFWEIHMHVDVLASFQTPLKALDAVIARQETKYNLYLNDGFFKTYQNPHVSIKPFPNGFTEQFYVLSVAGAGGTTPTPPETIADTNESDNI
jgi:hypothetical protein